MKSIQGTPYILPVPGGHAGLKKKKKIFKVHLKQHAVVSVLMSVAALVEGLSEIRPLARMFKSKKVKNKR